MRHILKLIMIAATLAIAQSCAHHGNHYPPESNGEDGRDGAGMGGGRGGEGGEGHYGGEGGRGGEGGDAH